MLIQYPTHHRWLRKNSNDPLAFFGANNKKKIVTSLDTLEENEIAYVIEPLNKGFFTWFTSLYEHTISSKAHPVIHPIYEKTLGKENAPYPYFSLTVTEHTIPIGGTIFSLREDRIAYAFRAFNTAWNTASIPASPPLLGEYIISKYVSGTTLEYISHGLDKNPYGINSSIGLAAFKLSVGCYPNLNEEIKINSLDTDLVTEDILVFTLPTQGIEIKNAYLVTLRDTESKYIQVSKYPELLKVEVLYRN